jgi:hypothetical protein
MWTHAVIELATHRRSAALLHAPMGTVNAIVCLLSPLDDVRMWHLETNICLMTCGHRAASRFAQCPHERSSFPNCLPCPARGFMALDIIAGTSLVRSTGRSVPTSGSYQEALFP